MRWAVAAVVISALIACRDGPTAPSPAELQAALPRTLTTDHYLFRFSESDVVDSAAQEDFHRWVETLLGSSFNSRIQYYKYRDRAQMQSLTGRATNGWAEPSALTVHSIHAADGHEAVHVITFPIGIPTDFWNEGIAVALDQYPARGITEPRWQGRPAHQVASELLATGRLPALATMIETDAFRRVEEVRGYPIAGSLVWYLVERFGVERLLDQFRGAARGDSATAIMTRFDRAYGRSLTGVEQEWLAFLSARSSR